MVLNIALVCLVVAMLLTIYRVLKGPSWGDRITAMDFLSSSLAVLIVVIALKTGFTDLLDIALIMSILSFLSTVALARYLINRRVIK
jgi:multisubunit Na+/H+ antiporter MnhF subunit